MGDHQGVGLGNLTADNQDKFADILAWAVEEYELDGIDLDDEWSDYGNNTNFPSSVSGSYSGLVNKLREKLDAKFPNEHKLITVLDYGYSYSLNSDARDAIDYAWYRYFGPNVYGSCSISGLPDYKWSPQALNLNIFYNTIYLMQIKNRSAQAVAAGMGALMTYDLRIATQRDPPPAINKIAEGADGATATYDGNAYAKDWSSSTTLTVTYDDIQQTTPPDEPIDPSNPTDSTSTIQPVTPLHPGFDFDCKSPSVVNRVHVDGTNPLNAGSYYMGSRPFFDICTIFAAGIRASGFQPALYLNGNVNSIISDVGKYIRPLQSKGIRVLLTVQGDHQGIGVGNLNDTNAEILADILAYMVEKYGLDGIDFDDQWAKYGENPNFPSSVNGSFSNLVMKLRDKLDDRFPDVHKLITVLNIGCSTSLSEAAVGDLDYAWYAYYSPNTYMSSSSPWINAKWSAQALYLSNNYNVIQLNQIKNRSTQTTLDGMGAIFTNDLRIRSEVDPLPALSKIAEGAFNGTVTYDDNAYTKDWTSTTSRLITISDIEE